MRRMKKIMSIGILMVMGVGVFPYSSPLSQAMQEALTGIPVYAEEEINHESFIPLNITLKNNQKEEIQVDYLCKIDDLYMIIGKISNLQSGYYLKGMTDQKETMEFHLSYADENIAFFTSYEQVAEFNSIELQLYEKKLEEKDILSTEEIDGDVFEDAVYGKENEMPVDKAFTVNLD